MTTGEAICCGVPVVVYRSTAIPESVGDGCGIILEPHDIEGVARAFEQILEQKEKYHESCLNYRYHFDKKAADRSYYELYKSMLSQKG